MPPVRFRQLAAIGVVLACAACATAPSPAGAASIKVGALFPLTGPQAPLAKQEYAGVQIARDFANADGGVAGAPIALITKELTSQSDAAVRVQELSERKQPECLYIRATIFVEHDSQKGIVIGKGGAALKRIGTAAREDLERFFGIKVFLQLTVAVRKGWRKDDRALKEFGFLLTS